MFHLYCLSSAFEFMQVGKKSEVIFFLNLNEIWGEGVTREMNAIALRRGCCYNFLSHAA